MPKLTTDERAVLEHVLSWYAEHRGALSAHAVAEVTGIPCARVSDAARVLAAAGRVRAYVGPRPHEEDREVWFLGLVSSRDRVVDLRAHATWLPRPVVLPA
ncbi:hypothetical protein [Kineococcus glutinatus]|uniref:hypothetical protein n=1 Tax=Kineococcus glutinatus TaxID=1070872 RepID=UPI0031E79BA0